jgi:hypothetical protein
MQKILLLIGYGLFSLSLSAQSMGGSSPFVGLNQFINSGFIQKFDEARTKAENSAKDFKKIQGEFSEEDVQAVADAYNAAAEEFNQILYKVKDDLLNKQQRKTIIRSPDIYAAGIEGLLTRAKENYANTYQKKVTQVTGGRITGIAFLVLLPELIKYGKIAFEIFKQIKSEIKKYNDQMMDTYLVQPYRFHAWDELQ